MSDPLTSFILASSLCCIALNAISITIRVLYNVVFFERSNEMQDIAMLSLIGVAFTILYYFDNLVAKDLPKLPISFW